MLALRWWLGGGFGTIPGSGTDSAAHRFTPAMFDEGERPGRSEDDSMPSSSIRW